MLAVGAQRIKEEQPDADKKPHIWALTHDDDDQTLLSQDYGFVLPAVS
jgi:hypothetical protein